MSRDELIALARRQDGQITTLSTQVADLVEANEQLAAKLAKLEHLLSRNSGNSSMPPSKDDDPGKTPPTARKPRGGPKRPKGKQPGAPGANLAWVDRPDDQQDRFPQGHCGCGRDLADATDLGVVDRYQQHEIPQVIPEGAGSVKRCVTVLFCFFVVVWARRGKASGSGLGRSPTAWRPKGLDAGAVRRTIWTAKKDAVVLPLGSGWVWTWRSSWPGCPRRWQARVGCCHPFAATGSGMMGFAVCWPDGINQRGDHATRGWGS